MDENERNEFDEQMMRAIASLGALMACPQVCRNQKAVMKINRFRAWLMDVKPYESNAESFGK